MKYIVLIIPYFWIIIFFVLIIDWLLSLLPVWTALFSELSAHVMWPSCVPRQQRYAIYSDHIAFVYLISQCSFFVCKQQTVLSFYFFIFAGGRQLSSLKRRPNNRLVCVRGLVSGWCSNLRTTFSRSQQSDSHAASLCRLRSPHKHSPRQQSAKDGHGAGSPTRPAAANPTVAALQRSCGSRWPHEFIDAKTDVSTNRVVTRED